jgi:hypothetical protein
MKHVITICILFCLITSCNRASEPDRLSVNAEILLSSNLFACPFDTCYTKNASVLQIRIRNNSEVSTSIWIMKCSWHDSFVFENNDFDFCLSSCPGNYPVEITLKPNEYISFYSLVQQKHSSYESQTFRVGFINLTEDELKDLPLPRDKDYQKTNETFWSNPVSMNYVTRGIKMN